MSKTFQAIGLEVPNHSAFYRLTERAGNCGEASRSQRSDCVWHGRCWKLGDGLEVWTIYYQQTGGELFYAACRPAFRPHFMARRTTIEITPWALTEFAEDGAAMLHGFVADGETEVLLELQNLTEIKPAALKKSSLSIALGGLAYSAKIFDAEQTKFVWRQATSNRRENDWTIGGKIVHVRTLQNKFSGCDLYCLSVATGEICLEVLCNQRDLRGMRPKVGAQIAADIWLQGYLLDTAPPRARFEGIAKNANSVDFWREFRRTN